MVSSIHIFPIVVLLFIKGCLTETEYCREAIESIKSVEYCPTSKEEWDKAANKKNCWIKASQQNCTSAENFVYHCVINGYSNAFFEVCAPQRVILGHCTEFNVLGGVIQDQFQSPCNDHFPKCDEYYNSLDAYKYQDCYKLVQKEMNISTSLSPPEYNATSRDTADRNSRSAIGIGLATGIISIAVVIIVIVFYVKRRRGSLENQKDKTQEGQSEEKNDLKLNNNCRNDRRKGHFEVQKTDETNSCYKNDRREGRCEVQSTNEAISNELPQQSSRYMNYLHFTPSGSSLIEVHERLTSPPSSPKAVLSSKSSGSSLSYLTPPVSPRKNSCQSDDKFTFNQ